MKPVQFLKLEDVSEQCRLHQWQIEHRESFLASMLHHTISHDNDTLQWNENERDKEVVCEMTTEPFWICMTVSSKSLDPPLAHLSYPFPYFPPTSFNIIHLILNVVIYTKVGRYQIKGDYCFGGCITLWLLPTLPALTLFDNLIILYKLSVFTDSSTLILWCDKSCYCDNVIFKKNGDINNLLSLVLLQPSPTLYIIINFCADHD